MRFSITALWVSIGLSVSIVSPSAQSSQSVADVWRQWRGPLRDGQWTGSTWPDRLNGRLELLWRQELAEGYSGPLVTADKVICFETKNADSEVVRAFDRETGEPLWSKEWPGAMKVPFFAAKRGSWVRSTPVTDGDYVYLAGMRDELVCLRAANGEEVWRVDLKERYGTSVPSFGLASSPLLYRDSLYVQAASSFLKLDPLTGETVWRVLVDEANDSPFSSPIVATLGAHEQLVVLMRHDLSGIDPESGNVLWQTPIESFRGMNILTPLSIGDSIFTAAYGGQSHLFDIVREGDSWKAQERWNNRLQGNMCSPVLVGGRLYFIGRNNRFNCVDVQSGKIAYSSERSFGDYQSLVVQGDKILGLEGSGTLFLYRANPEQFELLDELRISEEEAWAHLAVTNGRLYIRDLKGIAVYNWR